MAPRSGPDLDRLAQLEAERSFLLDSLRDLEAEHDAGDVDEHDYVTLRDGYTKRAADVLRQIDAGKAELAPKRPPNWPRRIGVIAAVVIATACVGWAVAAWSGQRTPGQEMTGRAVDERDDVTALLAEARALFSSGAFPAALARYQRVLEVDPGNVEARTYLGWLLVKTAEGSSDEATWQSALAAAEDAFTAVIERDDGYADPHCFLAATVVADDPELAREAAERCLALDPPADLADLASGVVAGLDAAPTTSP